MLDKSIPYYNIIMKRIKGTEFPEVILPDGYSFSSFIDGDEIYWAEIETSIGEFDNINEALDCFRNEYLTNIDELKKRLIFIENKDRKKVGTLTNWWNYSKGVREPSIHWVGVTREFQGLGLGKAIVFEGMRRMIQLEGDRDFFLHTQTWSYKAINIYIQAGYRIVNDEAFGNYINESEKAMPIIRDKIRNIENFLNKQIIINFWRDKMRYIEDKNFEYKDELIKKLRAYNLKHIGKKDSSTEYFYALDGEKLVGSVYTNYSWDWVGIGSMFYENTNVLKKLISEVSHYYKNKAIGMKLYTEVESRVEDFKSIGFSIGGIIEGTPRTTRYFYLKTIDFDIASNFQTEIVVVTEKIDKYNSILLNKIERYNRDNDIYPMEERNLMLAALNNDKFVGGVHGSITEDSMYIAWLVVDEEYRGNGIGKTLMCKMEEKAKELNVYSINLGTVEFQAREFYEKLGYKVVFVKENDPRGFKTYSMLKII